MLLARCRARPPSRARCVSWGRSGLLALLLPLGAPGQPARTTGTGDVLEEIIVTARKVEEDLFAVPLSVQVLDGDFIETTDLTSVFELQHDVPGLVVTSAGGFGAGIALRGVTDAGGGSLAVAPHSNGVYLGTPQLALTRLFDVERVEVLKGPQGTLYGRNATGGSINVISRVPEDTFSAAVESAWGSFDTVRVRGHINVPTDGPAVRVAFAGSDGNGYIRNSIDDRNFAAEDYSGLRASVRGRPSEPVTYTVLAQRVRDDGASGELWLPRKDHLVDPDDIRLTTVTLDDPHLSMTNDLVHADVRYERDRVTLRYIGGYARGVTHNLDDCAGLPELRDCIRGLEPASYEQRSQELQLVSPAGAVLDWLVGLYYLDADESTSFHFSLPAAGSINDYTATSEEVAYATFGHVTRHLNDRWSVSGGLRLSHETDRVTTRGTGVADSPVPISARGAWDATSWRFGVQYTPTPNGTLVYANVATGFKSGGVAAEILPTSELDSFDPEHVTAYEAGVKLRLPDRRWALLASGFLYDFEDLQVRTTALVANRVTSVVDNAAAARIHGLDLSATFQPRDRLTLSAGMVYLPRREFVEFVNVATGDTLSGNELGRAPELTASVSVGYSRSLREIGVLSGRVDYNYRSGFFFTKENDPALAQDAFGLLNLFLRFQSADEGWYLFASARNALDVDYFNQVFIQSSPGHPAHYELGFGVQF